MRVDTDWHTLTDCKVREDGSHRAERGEGLTTGQVHRWRGPDTGLGALTLTREHHKVIYPAPLGLPLFYSQTLPSFVVDTQNMNEVSSSSWTKQAKETNRVPGPFWRALPPQ